MFEELDNLDPLTARAFSALHRTLSLHKRGMVKELSAVGAHPVEAFCLRLLLKEDGMSQRDLAERLHVSRPWMTRLLQSMERSGLVVRRDDEQDQRLTRVFLTHEGRERERGHRDVIAAYLAKTLGSLPDDDKMELERILDCLNTIMAAGTEESSDDAGGSRRRSADGGEPRQ